MYLDRSLVVAAWKVIRSWLPAAAMRKMKFVNKETIGDFLQVESRLVEWGGSCHQGPGWVADQRSVRKVRPVTAS